MTGRMHLHGLLLAILLTGCAAEDEYETPQLPPPPPPAPPPTAVAPTSEPYGTQSSAVTQAQGSDATPAQPTTPPPAPPPAAQAPAVASPQAPAPVVASDQTQWVYTYPTGQWVYMVDHGWVWVPSGTAPVTDEGVPYVYLYTPLYGWTWYVSPWGWGPYRYGFWIHHPWHPYGWHGRWVAHPYVVGHLGGRGYYGGHVYGGGHYGGGHYGGHRR